MALSTTEAPTETVCKYHELENPRRYVLDAHYRCDSCGAQAYIRATFKNESELFFCRHHGREHREAISPYLSEWYTEESRLFEHNKLVGSEN